MTIRFFLTILAMSLSLGLLAGERGGGGGGDGGGRGPDPAAAAREAAEARVGGATNTRNMTPEERKRAQADRKQDLADYKQATKENLASITALFKAAEQAWGEMGYKLAGSYYLSVSKATVPGSEEMVATSIQRINADMEKLGKQHIATADDAILQRDFMKAIDELTVVTTELDITAAAKDATRRLTSLKSKPEVAGFIEFSKAQTAISSGKLTEGMEMLKAIVNNSRYENTLPALRATKALEELGKNEDTRSRLKTEFVAKADKECPRLLLSARNFANNSNPKKAQEQLNVILDKYPDTAYAEEARKLMEGLASSK